MSVECIAGVNKNIGIAASGACHPLFIGYRLQCTAGSSADSNDTPALLTNPIDAPGGVLSDVIAFGVHDMFCNVLFLYRSESTETNMQCDGYNINAHGANSVHQLGGKMQSRSRCGSGPCFAAVDRLIAVFILQAFFNVVRQRHGSQTVQHFGKYTFVFKLNHTVAIVQDLNHFSAQFTAAETNARPGSHLFSGKNDTFPQTSARIFEQQYFDSTACALFFAVQPGWQDFGVIDDKTVAGTQKFT